MQGLDLIYGTIVMKGKSYNGPRLETLSTRSDISVHEDKICCYMYEEFFCFLLSKILNMSEIVLLSAGFALHDGGVARQKNWYVPFVPRYKSNGLFRKICELVQRRSLLCFSSSFSRFYNNYFHNRNIISKISKLNYIFNLQQSRARIYLCIWWTII